jgi:lysophospholipase L1-like esterase/dienelactone hydrolase
MIKKHFIVLCILSYLLSGDAYSQKRFIQDIFQGIDSITAVGYGEATNINGKREELLLDIYMPPATDTLRSRPLVIFIHGGGFQNGSRKADLGVMLCKSLTRKGYVTASIDYRLGVGKQRTETDYAEAMYRAQQDGRAAVRFLRRYAEKYGIDTSQIFIAGTSAGGMTSLAMAYMDDNEIPAGVDKGRWGTLEGDGGHASYSSHVQGVINCWGSMPDLNWIKRGDAPLFNTAGTADKTVPFDSSFSYHGFKHGPYTLYERCLTTGVPTAWRPFYGAGHTLDNNKQKWDSCRQSMTEWLYTQLRRNGAGSSEGVTRWEKEIRVFDSLNKAEAYPEGSVMFLGSSYIRLWENIRKDVGQPNIIHRGFGGCNLSDVAYYVRRIVYPHKPRALFIYVGNDIVAGERDKSPEQVLELFRYVVKTVREKHPDMPIAWLQISPSERRWAAWDRISRANELIRQYCLSEKGLHYIPSSEKFLGKDGLPIKKYYRDDKLHYNEEGYRVWGANIRKPVRKILNK